MSTCLSSFSIAFTLFVSKRPTATTSIPGCRPAAAAGDFASTSVIKTPELSRKPLLAASFSSTSCTAMPKNLRIRLGFSGIFSPRSILRNSSTLSRTTLPGIANPMPCVGTPCGVNDIFTDEIPTSFPAMSTIGPPLLPGLMAASVCTRF